MKAAGWLEVLQGGTRYSARDLPSEDEMAEFTRPRRPS